jgi:protein-disulfide isomerase
VGQGVVSWRLWCHRKSNIDLRLKTLGGGLSTAAIAVALAILGFNMLKPTATLPPELQDLPGKRDITQGLPQFTPNAVDILINKNPYSGMGEDFRKGSDDAKIVIVEFADYMCPACGQTAPILEEVHKQLGDRALLVFKNYPLSNQCNVAVQSDMHPYSCDIAKLARCAGSIGKFWDYHLMAFEHQSKASKQTARDWGRKVGLSDQQMDGCLASQDITAKIRDDVDVGNKVGVNSTPTIFINGRKYLGERSASAIRAAIESL